MEHIGRPLEEIEHNMKLNSADPIALHGFTQLPNFILRDPKISIGAKTAYSLLLSYAWHNDLCFPGQDRPRRGHGHGHRQREPVHQGTRGLFAHRNRAPRAGEDELLHRQLRREAEAEILISTGGNLDFHWCKSRIPPVEFTQYKNTHLRIHIEKYPVIRMHL